MSSDNDNSENNDSTNQPNTDAINDRDPRAERGGGRHRHGSHHRGPGHDFGDNEADRKLMRKFKRRHMWKIPFVFAGFILIKSALVMVLWNALVPDLFHGPVIDYVQAVGLSILAKLLIGFGFGGGRGFGPGRHFGGRGGVGGGFGGGGPWGRGRWDNMTPEQREKIRARLEKRFAD